MGNESYVGPQRVHGVSNVPSFGSHIVESWLDVFHGGWRRSSGDWTTGEERRCMEEYALAVKGKMAYATLPKIVAEHRLDVKGLAG